MTRQKTAMQSGLWIRVGKVLVLAMLWVTLPSLGGCGPSDDVLRAPVKGKVTLDGEPVRYGRLMFEPTGDTKGPVAGGSIDDGAYEIGTQKGVVVGKNLVRINWLKKTGRQFEFEPGSGIMIDETEEVIPGEYNTESTLQVDVQPGENVLDFELTSE